MIYFLGDSIFEHSLYMDIEDTLLSKLLSAKYDINMVAEDNAKIKDVYPQFNSIKRSLNKDDIIFLSVGGNDLIEEIMDSDDNDTNKNSYKTLELIMRKYTKLVEYIRSYDSITLYVCTIYKPPFKKIYPFHKYVDIWNNNIIRKYKQNIIMLHDLCFENKHFINVIEPSELCVDLLFEKIKNILSV